MVEKSKTQKLEKLELRVLMSGLLGFLIDFSLRKSRQDDFKKSAIVFSPHQDDETLGCGGTIAKKRRVGAEVKIVFMTDGCNASSTLTSKEELKSVRIAEAISAAAELGVKESNVLFLGYTDGSLRQFHAAAVEKIRNLLSSEQPQEIFIPYYKDGHGDHNETHRIVSAALEQSGINVTVYEYPVWFWNHWPWVKVGFSHYGAKALKKSIRYSWPRLRDFNCYVDIKEVLPVKQAAFDCYKSQEDLDFFAEGTFIDLFWRNREYFRRYEIKRALKG